MGADVLQHGGGQSVALAKLIRLGTMLAQILDEVHNDFIREETCARLRPIHEAAVHELIGVLPADLRAEFERVATDLSSSPSCPELRVAEAQVLGWLQGLVQAMLVEGISPAGDGSQSVHGAVSEAAERPRAYM